MIQTTRGNEALTVRHQIGIVSGFKIGNTVRLRRNPHAGSHFSAFGRGADQNQDALLFDFHPGLQIDAVGPDAGLQPLETTKNMPAHKRCSPHNHGVCINRLMRSSALPASIAFATTASSPTAIVPRSWRYVAGCSPRQYPNRLTRSPCRGGMTTARLRQHLDCPHHPAAPAAEPVALLVRHLMTCRDHDAPGSASPGAAGARGTRSPQQLKTGIKGRRAAGHAQSRERHEATTTHSTAPDHRHRAPLAHPHLGQNNLSDQAPPTQSP